MFEISGDTVSHVRTTKDPELGLIRVYSFRGAELGVSPRGRVVRFRAIRSWPSACLWMTAPPNAVDRVKAILATSSAIPGARELVNELGSPDSPPSHFIALRFRFRVSPAEDGRVRFRNSVELELDTQGCLRSLTATDLDGTSNAKPRVAQGRAREIANAFFSRYDMRASGVTLVLRGVRGNLRLAWEPVEVSLGDISVSAGVLIDAATAKVERIPDPSRHW
jgi:hypothetical protein